MPRGWVSVSEVVKDEFRETLDWLGGYLRESFPEHFKDSNISSFPKSLLYHWQKEVGEIPGETCPAIDKILRRINLAITSVKAIQEMRSCSSEEEICNIKKASNYASDAEKELSDIEYELEILRKSNQQLRALGKFWYGKLISLKIDWNENTINGVEA